MSILLTCTLPCESRSIRAAATPERLRAILARTHDPRCRPRERCPPTNASRSCGVRRPANPQSGESRPAARSARIDQTRASPERTRPALGDQTNAVVLPAAARRPRMRTVGDATRRPRRASARCALRDLLADQRDVGPGQERALERDVGLALRPISLTKCQYFAALLRIAADVADQAPSRPGSRCRSRTRSRRCPPFRSPSIVLGTPTTAIVRDPRSSESSPPTRRRWCSSRRRRRRRVPSSLSFSQVLWLAAICSSGLDLVPPRTDQIEPAGIAKQREDFGGIKRGRDSSLEKIPRGPRQMNPYQLRIRPWTAP